VSLLAPIRVLALALALGLPAAGAVTAPEHAAGAGAKQKKAVVAKRKPRPLRRGRPTLGDRAAQLAVRAVGTPYVWGGAGPGGYDCSGLTSWVYGELGVPLPHNAAAQFDAGRPVQRSRLHRGDLLFFDGLGHVGLYLGNGRMVHAPESGRSVEVVPLAGRYAERLVGARRVARA
jgi:cell wall-associated NlpC family hydrolase